MNEFTGILIILGMTLALAAYVTYLWWPLIGPVKPVEQDPEYIRMTVERELALAAYAVREER